MKTMKIGFACAMVLIAAASSAACAVGSSDQDEGDVATNGDRLAAAPTASASAAAASPWTAPTLPPSHPALPPIPRWRVGAPGPQLVCGGCHAEMSIQFKPE